jgi:hypothetical protein
MKDIATYYLSPGDLKALGELIFYAKKTYESAEQEEFIKEAKALSGKLPEGLKRFLYASDRQNHEGIFVVKGFEHGDLPNTPISWFKEDSYPAAFDCDYAAIILSAILGEPFGFETQQVGKLIHDILPIKGREYAQEGANSLQMLNLHTEDTFHPYRADHICLVCLKNPSSVGTLVSGVRHFDLTDEVKSILFQNRFYHLSDDTHVEDLVNPICEPILFGDRQRPYLCYDEDFTVSRKGDESAQRALEALREQARGKHFEVSLEPGDFCFIDNYKWLHGRRPFKANYDGNDRWLRRFNIKLDLNEASEYRLSPVSRMLSFSPIHIPTKKLILEVKELSGEIDVQ